MTTIACNKDTMAGDSRCADASSMCNVTKIFRIGEKLVGVAGAYANCMEFIKWMRGGMDADMVPDMDNVYALVLSSRGIAQYDGHPTPFYVRDKFAAVGSGCQAALAAMICGKTPSEAVRVAAKVDSHTGGRVTTKSL